MALRYICSLPNPGVRGNVRELFYTDDAEGRARAEAFAQRENRPSRGVYDCIGLLKDGAKSRCRETVVELDQIVADLDFRTIAESPDQILECLKSLLLPPSEVRDSGHGLHPVWHLKEAACGEDQLARSEAVMKQLAPILAADTAPTHRAALLRRPETDNTKGDEPRRCRVIERSEASYDISEFDEMLELYGDRPLLTPKERLAKANGYDPGDIGEGQEPVDVEARVAAMQFEGPGDSSIHLTQLAATASLLRAGQTVDSVVEEVLAATQRAVAGDPRTAEWNWRVEQWTIERLCFDFISNKHPELYELLPDYLLQSWRKRLEAGDEHIKVAWASHRGSWYVTSRKSRGTTNNDSPSHGEAPGDPGSDGPAAPHSDTPTGKAKGSAARKIIRAIPFTAFDEAALPPREFLFGKHYQRGQATATIGPGGAGKTSYSQVESVSMTSVRNLLGEQPEQRLKVWLHNGDDDKLECDRRIAAICRHYKIAMTELEGWLFVTSKSDFQIRLATGNGTLVIDHASIAQIVTTILQNQIDVAIFDPLVTLHAVTENDNVKMNAVIHLFGQIAEDCNCGIELCHHTRKLLNGAEGYSVDDGRGASAIRDALRATRVVNAMTVEEARNAGVAEDDRLSYLRVNRGKANYLPPAAKAAWFKFESVTLLNEDNVGVLVPWQYPGQDSFTSEVTETQRTVEHVFMQLLARFTLGGREVSDRKNSSAYAPAVFAEEREAKVAKAGRKVLEMAMRRLFEANRIRVDVVGKHGRHQIVAG